MSIDTTFLWECGQGLFGEEAKELATEVKRLMAAEKRKQNLLLHSRDALMAQDAHDRLVKEIDRALNE